jgi:hypothetical protein
MPSTPDWRSPAAYTYLNNLTPAELAWEFLRRNPNYQRDVQTPVSKTIDEDELPEPVARRWGLRFRSQSRVEWRQGRTNLAAAA